MPGLSRKLGFETETKSGGQPSRRDPLNPRLWGTLVVSSLAAFACEGVIGVSADDPAKTPGNGAGSGAASPDGGGPLANGGGGAGNPSGEGGTSGGAAGGAAAGAGSPGQPEACLDAVFQASSAPLRRLSSAEYRNTVRALFPDVTLPDFEIIPDDRLDGFTNSVAGQSGSALAIEQYARAAEVLATAAASDLGAWAPCTEQTPECADRVARDLAFKAYRRPLDAAESQRVSDFVATAAADHGAAAAVEMAVQALLESPYFLYRPEFGSQATVGDAAVHLGGYEMASRLSYFFLQTMPDDMLFAAAEAGTLTTEAGIREQAERLLADSRARPVLATFFAEWLKLYELEELSLDPNTFPVFDDALRRDLEESARLYVEKALWEDDSWHTLMTGSYGYVNDRLAPIFGVSAPGTDELVYTELDPTERKGVLTQPGLLAATSHGIRHSPILRGVTMLSNILCAPPPAPPPGILDNDDDAPLPSNVCTTRDEVSETHTNGDGCEVCHNAIDGAGFTFENYDALGRYRTEENGCPVDATGVFPTSDIEGTVQNAVELADHLASSATVAECAGEHLFRYALGRAGSRDDRCEIRALAGTFNQDDSLQGLVLRLVLSPSFRSRPAP